VHTPRLARAVPTRVVAACGAHPLAPPRSAPCADDDIPEYFLCPITGCIMRQPAMTPEGVTYDYVRSQPNLARTRAQQPCMFEACSFSSTNAERSFSFCLPAHALTLCSPPQDAISEWLANKSTDPSTNLPLSRSELCPNRTVRSMIEDFIAKGPDFLIKKKGL